MSGQAPVPDTASLSYYFSSYDDYRNGKAHHIELDRRRGSRRTVFDISSEDADELIRFADAQNADAYGSIYPFFTQDGEEFSEKEFGDIGLVLGSRVNIHPDRADEWIRAPHIKPLNERLE
jgi:hypothetical protein